MFKNFFIFTFLFLISSCRNELGIRPASLSPNFIVGGELTNEEKFSSVVAIIRSRDVFCSGVAISETVVLTAAHCLVNQSALSLSVYVGDGYKLPRADRRDVKGQYKIKSMHIHPSIKHDPFRGITNLGEHDANDVGLLILEKKLENVQINKIALDANQIISILDPGNELTVVGYGYSSENLGYGEPAEYGMKRKVNIPVVNYNHHEVDARALGKDSCYIDSGGPAYVNIDGSPHLLALVSRAKGLCGEAEFPVLYSLVFDSICWISEYVNLDLSLVDMHCRRNQRISDQCFDLTDDRAIECAQDVSDRFLIDETNR